MDYIELTEDDFWVFDPELRHGVNAEKDWSTRGESYWEQKGLGFAVGQLPLFGRDGEGPYITDGDIPDGEALRVSSARPGRVILVRSRK